LVKPGRFNPASDLDVALECEPAGVSVYGLASLLSERLGRRVDLVSLSECRFRETILREGERWTLPS
jgi:predicted nucleotidyltransferase